MAIIINGKSYLGNSITVSKNKVIVDGIDVTPDGKQININVENDINELIVDCCEKINVGGNVNKIKTSSGDVYCENVTGDIQTKSGDVECGDVGGSIQTTSGDVNCKNVNGSVKTISGDIKNKK
jgi:hypothetical protein